MAHIENKKLVEYIFNELESGNSAPLLESLADDFRFVVMGSGKWSRAYEGKQAVLEQLFRPLLALIDGRLTNRAHRFTAEGDIVVVEARGRNRTKDGKAYNNAYCNVLRLEGGKLKEWMEYSDTLLVDAVLGDPADALKIAD